MHETHPRVFLISAPQLNTHGVNEWLAYLGADQFNTNTEHGQGTALVQLAAKRCYMAFQTGLNPNITRIREDMTAYIDNILKSGHGSVLAHAHFSFAIEGLTRVCTAELNRHFIGVDISEGSLRYIRFDDIGYWIPDSIRRQSHDAPELDKKKERSRNVFRIAFGYAEKAYQDLEAIWDDELNGDFAGKKKLTSMFRRIVPMGASTGGVWSFNLRSLRHILELRGTEHAEEEILLVARLLFEKMHETEPLMFHDFEDHEGHLQCLYHKV